MRTLNSFQGAHLPILGLMDKTARCWLGRPYVLGYPHPPSARNPGKQSSIFDPADALLLPLGPFQNRRWTRAGQKAASFPT